MAKTKTPYFSLGAQGSVGRSITAQKRASETLIRSKPLPTDPYSLPQAYQRWLYEDYAYLWTQQSAATRAAYRTGGVRFHLTGFQYWMKYQLKNLPDIAGMWHLDTKTSAIEHDYSKNSNHGTIFGVSSTTGLIDGAGNFDGLNDWIQIPHSPSLDITSVFTLELFFNLNTVPAFWCPLFGKVLAGVNAGYTMTINPAGNLIGQLPNPLGALNTTAYLLTTDTWYHALFIYDGTQIHLFIDGVEVLPAVNAPNPPVSLPNSLNIGRYNALARYLDCQVDEARLTIRVLDQTEITRHCLRRYPA